MSTKLNYEDTYALQVALSMPGMHRGFWKFDTVDVQVRDDRTVVSFQQYFPATTNLSAVLDIFLKYNEDGYLVFDMAGLTVWNGREWDSTTKDLQTKRPEGLYRLLKEVHRGW